MGRKHPKIWQGVRAALVTSVQGMSTCTGASSRGHEASAPPGSRPSTPARQPAGRDSQRHVLHSQQGGTGTVCCAPALPPTHTYPLRHQPHTCPLCHQPTLTHFHRRVVFRGHQLLEQQLVQPPGCTERRYRKVSVFHKQDGSSAQVRRYVTCSTALGQWAAANLRSTRHQLPLIRAASSFTAAP